MKKFLIKIAIFCLLIIAGLYTLDWYFTATFKEGKTNKTQWLDRKNQEAYDLAIIGSSRAWWNIDMNVINSDMNINSINLANNHFSYSEMLLRLKRLYENENTINHLLIQAEYWNAFLETEELSTSSYNYLPYLDDPTTYEHLKAKSPEWMLYKHVPFWRYAEYNFQWGVEEVLITKLDIRNSIFDSTGTYYSNNDYYGRPKWYASIPKSTKLNPDFVELLEFCDHHHIEPHVFTAPIYKAIFSQKNQVEFEFNLVESKVDYDNYLDIFTDSTYFNNNTHLSLKGGKVFTQELLNKIRSFDF